MRSFHSLKLLALSTIAVFPAVSSAQTTVYSNVVGFDTVTCSTGTTGGLGSDSMVSASMHQCPEFVGSVGTVAGTTISPSVAVTWTINQFRSGGALSHYVRMTSGAQNGQYYDVLSNTASGIVLDTSGMPVPAPGDSFKVIPFWTLDTLFPPATQTTFIVSGGTATFLKRSSLFLPDFVTTGINLVFAEEYIITSAGWQRVSAGFPAAGGDVIRPDVPFTIRHKKPSLSGVASTQYVISGEVSYDAAAVNAATQTGTQQQDNAVAFQRPVDVEIQDLGFVGGSGGVGTYDFEVSSGTATFQRKDRLLVFDYSTPGINKVATRQYIMVGTNWVRIDTGFPIANTDVISSSTGLVIRKYQTSGGFSSVTINTPNY